jgi:hypothetical protein
MNSSLPDYASDRANILPQQVMLNGKIAYNLVAHGPDGVIGIADTDPQRAMVMLDFIRKGMDSAAMEIMPAKTALVPRIGDQARNKTLDHLSQSFQDGQITQDEFNDRSATAFAAKTQPELDALTRDIPLASKAEVKIKPAHDLAGHAPGSCVPKADYKATQVFATSLMLAVTVLMILFVLTITGVL